MKLFLYCFDREYKENNLCIPLIFRKREGFPFANPLLDLLANIKHRIVVKGMSMNDERKKTMVKAATA